MISYPITVLVYVISTVLSIILAVMSFKRGWPGVLKRLFVGLVVMAIVLYPIYIHECVKITYYWFKYGCPT